MIGPESHASSHVTNPRITEIYRQDTHQPCKHQGPQDRSSQPSLPLEVHIQSHGKNFCDAPGKQQEHSYAKRSDGEQVG